MADTNIIGKSVLIDRQPAVLYSALGDLNALVANLPEDKKEMITATQDTISASFQGINFGMKVAEREPFSRVTFTQTDGTPIEFSVKAFFDSVDDPSRPEADVKTNFHIELSAQLGFMMKMMLGGKLQGLVDKLTDTLAAAAAGQHIDLNPESFI
jgi:hypothetical protein